MDKRILEEYIDACEVIKEAEAEIRKLESKKSITANETVSGSNPEFPYNPQHFKVQGTTYSYSDDVRIRQKKEILRQKKEKAEQLKEIIATFSVEAKIVVRKKYYVVYIKEGSQIVELLGLMEAHVALMELENIRILKEMRNSVNRQVNCETANISKTVNAAVKQLEDITYIREMMGLDSLPDNLKEMALLRLEYPEAPLKELGMYLDPPVGKSGVNHRLRKISEIADGLRE